MAAVQSITLDSPLHTLLDNIQGCLGSGIYYAALVTALTIPDICAALESDGAWATREKYKDWYKTYLGGNYPNLTPDDCYYLRCGVLHQGKLGRHGMQYSRVLFTVPNRQNNVFHNNIINDALNLDVVIFCNDVVAAAQAWYELKKDDPFVLANLPNLVRDRPEGLSPYMVGVPLIA